MIRTCLGAFSLIFCLSLAPLALGAEKDTAPEIEYKEDVEYGTGGGMPLKLDIARPLGLTEPAPGLVFIHGGGWAAGNKAIYRKFIQSCAEQGYVAVTVGYRFAPAHRFPAQVEDVKCAVRWLRAHADELGLDPERIGAMGHSAGAHLSMMLGVMDAEDGLEGEGGWADQPSKVQCVVSYFGPTDLTMDEDAVASLAAADVLNLNSIRRILENLVGGNDEEHKEMLRQASPITYVNKGDAPMLLLHGTRDVLVPYDQAFQMATALSRAGVPGRVEIILGLGHGWAGDEAKRTNDVTLDFFNQHLKPSSK